MIEVSQPNIRQQMLALLRRVGGDGRDEENPDGAGKSAQRVVPQLALDKLNAAPDKIEGRGGQREAEREAPPRSAGRSERPPPPQKSTAAPPDVGGIHASLKFTGTVSLCVSVIVELMDEAGDLIQQCGQLWVFTFGNHSKPAWDARAASL